MQFRTPMQKTRRLHRRSSNHQQDGFHRDTINTGNANYHPNSIGSGCPFLAGGAGFVHRQEKLHGTTTRARSESGKPCIALLEDNGDAIHFLQEAYKHYKAIAALGDAIDLLVIAELDEATVADGNGSAGVVSDLGVVTARAASDAGELGKAFALAIARHRHWERAVEDIPA